MLHEAGGDANDAQMSRLRRLVVRRPLQVFSVALLVVSIASTVLTIGRQLEPQSRGAVAIVSMVLAGIVTILERIRPPPPPEVPPEEVRRHGRQALLEQMRGGWVEELLEGPFER